MQRLIGVPAYESGLLAGPAWQVSGAARLNPASPHCRACFACLTALPQWVVDQRIQANIAVETDYEFYTMFRGAANPVTEAINYISSLIGCECLLTHVCLLQAGC